MWDKEYKNYIEMLGLKDLMDEFGDMFYYDLYSNKYRNKPKEITKPNIKIHGATISKVVYNNPHTIVFWSDNTETRVKCDKQDTYSKETGFMLCILKKLCGGLANEILEKWVWKSNKNSNVIEKRANK